MVALVINIGRWIAAVSFFCLSVEITAGAETSSLISETVELWVKDVVSFSSQYNPTSWSAATVIGQPTVYPAYGDLAGTWTPGTITSSEFIVVDFAEKLFITGIEIYETLNAGAVVRISAYDPCNNWTTTLWEAEKPMRIQHSRIFTPTIIEMPFKASRIKLDLDCTAAGTWVEIDAIKMKGKRQTPFRPSPVSLVRPSPISELRRLVNDGLFSDVKFLVKGREVLAHRAILAVRSSYFRALLSNRTLERRLMQPNETIVVDDVSYSGFLSMMQFIYANTFDASTSLELLELIRMGDKFNLSGMKTLGFSHLSNIITTDDVIDLYRNAVENLPHIESVENICQDFIIRNLKTVTRLPAFSNLPRNLMLKLIQEAALKLSLCE